MAIINVRRVRDAFVRAEVTDEAKGLELATSLDEELSEAVVSTERFETLEERIDARFDAHERQMAAQMDARFAQAEADAERRANRQTAIVIGALAVAVGIIGILIAVL